MCAFKITMVYLRIFTDFTANNYILLTSAFEVNDGIVQDSYRVDEANRFLDKLNLISNLIR